MKELSRRGFLTRSSIGLAIAGAAAAIPGLNVALRTGPAAPARAVAPSGALEPLIVHVRDAANGEMSLLVGTEQKIVHDQDLVFRLYGLTR